MAQDRWDRMAAIMRALDNAGVLDALVEKKTAEDLRRERLHRELTDPRPPQGTKSESLDRWGWTHPDGVSLTVIRSRDGVLVDLDNHAFALPGVAMTSLKHWLEGAVSARGGL